MVDHDVRAGCGEGHGLDAELSETDDAGAHHIASQVVQAPDDVGFTIPAQASTYWNGEAMHGTDHLDLEQTPSVTATTNAHVAANAAFLARLLKQAPYPPQAS